MPREVAALTLLTAGGGDVVVVAGCEARSRPKHIACDRVQIDRKCDLSRSRWSYCCAPSRP